MDVKPAQLMGALTNGNIDAAMIWNIDINTVEAQLKGNAIVWPAQSSQATYSVVACRDDWAAGHPEEINRFLKSVGQAEEFPINHPDEVKAILQKRLNYTDAYVSTIWPNHQFSLTLDQSLIAAMEDEARWTISNNLTAEKTVPDFMKYIYTKGIKEVKPDCGEYLVNETMKSKLGNHEKNYSLDSCRRCLSDGRVWCMAFPEFRINRFRNARIDHHRDNAL